MSVSSRCSAGPGSSAELLDQQRPRAAQDRERVALAAGAVQGEREQAPGVLAPRVLGDVRVRSGTASAARPEREPRSAPPLDRLQPQLGQPGALGARPGRVGEVRRTRARATARAPRRGASAASAGRLARRSSARSNRQASTASGGAQRVPGRSVTSSRAGRPRRPVRLQRPAQRADERAERAHGARRRLSPQVVDERPTGTTRPRAAISRASTARCRGPFRAIRSPVAVPGHHRPEHAEGDAADRLLIPPRRLGTMHLTGFDYRRVPVADGVSLNAAVGGSGRRSCCCTASRRPT